MQREVWTDLIASSAVNLPITSGWDVFERITAIHPFLPIIIITARPDQYELHRLPALSLPRHDARGSAERRPCCRPRTDA